MKVMYLGALAMLGTLVFLHQSQNMFGIVLNIIILFLVEFKYP